MSFRSWIDGWVNTLNTPWSIPFWVVLASLLVGSILFILFIAVRRVAKQNGRDAKRFEGLYRDYSNEANRLKRENEFLRDIRGQIKKANKKSLRGILVVLDGLMAKVKNDAAAQAEILSLKQRILNQRAFMESASAQPGQDSDPDKRAVVFSPSQSWGWPESLEGGPVILAGGEDQGSVDEYTPQIEIFAARTSESGWSAPIEKSYNDWVKRMNFSPDDILGRDFRYQSGFCILIVHYRVKKEASSENKS